MKVFNDPFKILLVPLPSDVQTELKVIKEPQNKHEPFSAEDILGIRDE
jgi:hypothetical protein